MRQIKSGTHTQTHEFQRNQRNILFVLVWACLARTHICQIIWLIKLKQKLTLYLDNRIRMASSCAVAFKSFSTSTYGSCHVIVLLKPNWTCTHSFTARELSLTIIDFTGAEHRMAKANMEIEKGKVIITTDWEGEKKPSLYIRIANELTMELNFRWYLLFSRKKRPKIFCLKNVAPASQRWKKNGM